MKLAGYTIHPATDTVPEMTSIEYGQLVDSMRADGQLEPIIRDTEGRILDGRHRLKACLELKYRPKFTTYKGKAPVALVVAHAIQRRNLSPSQRAAASAELLPLYRQEVLARQRKRARRSGNSQEVLEQKAKQIAAGAAQVSYRTLARADRVQKTDAELFAEVKAGKVSLTEADTRIADQILAETPLLDGLGHTVPPDLRSVFEGCNWMDRLAADIAQIRRRVTAMADAPCMKAIALQELTADLRNAERAMTGGIPYVLMPPKLLAKEAYGRRKWLTEAEYKRVAREFRW